MLTKNEKKLRNYKKILGYWSRVVPYNIVLSQCTRVANASKYVTLIIHLNTMWDTLKYFYEK